jgi:hypothetical protein
MNFLIVSLIVIIRLLALIGGEKQVPAAAV